MSSLRGARMSGKRAFKASTIAAVSSTDSVVWVRNARFAAVGTATDRRHPRPSPRGSSTPAGTWPNVPMTSGWPAWPMNRMCRPSSIRRCGLAVDLGDERAGRVDVGEPAVLRRRRAPIWERRGPRRPPGDRREPRRAHRRTPRRARAGGRPRSDCGRSRAEHRPARRTARARARRSGSPDRRRRKSRAVRRSAREWRKRREGSATVQAM